MTNLNALKQFYFTLFVLGEATPSTASGSGQLEVGLHCTEFGVKAQREPEGGDIGAENATRSHGHDGAG
jgi:hypothetical protein